jgi:heptaprenylglyceryl phosphate synthase
MGAARRKEDSNNRCNILFVNRFLDPLRTRFNRLLKRLCDAEIDFVIVGGSTGGQ